MIVYLASPGSQLQADHARDMPVLLSYGTYHPFLDGYIHSFSRVLLDSGAFSFFNSGQQLDGVRYQEWAEKREYLADARAGIDDISGDWKKSLSNYEKYRGFPTIHDSDPPELLKDLIPIAYANRKWIGIGLVPPRQGKESFVRWVCDNVPDDLHVHGWALRAYAHIRRINSIDSTNWWRRAFAVRKTLPWLTYGEAIEIVVKYYKREPAVLRDDAEQLKIWEISEVS